MNCNLADRPPRLTQQLDQLMQAGHRLATGSKSSKAIAQGSGAFELTINIAFVSCFGQVMRTNLRSLIITSRMLRI